MRSTHRRIALLALLAAGVAGTARAGGSQFGRRYSKEELEALEKEWEDGDEEEDLLTEGQIKYREIEARRNQPMANMGSFDPSNPQEWLRQSKIGDGKPQMMFVTLRDPMPKGDKWEGVALTREKVTEVGGMWREQLLLGNVECTFYDIEDDKLLATLQTGWDS